MAVDMTVVIKNRAAVFTLVYCQLAIVLIIAVIFYMVYGFIATISLLLGALVYLIPNSCFIGIALTSKVAAQGHQSMLNWFFLGELVKIMLTIILFALCFAFIQLNIGLFFVTYGIMLISTLLGTALINSKIDLKNSSEIIS